MVRVHMYVFGLVAMPFLLSCGREVSSYSSTPGGRSQQEHIFALCEQRHLSSLGLSPERPYESCAQISQHYKTHQDFQSCIWTEDSKRRSGKPNASSNTAESSDAVASGSLGSAPQAKSQDVLANLRHAGVDEDDFVKISARQIFVSTAQGIQVVERSSKKLLGTLRPSAPEKESSQRTGQPERTSSNPKLLLGNNVLVVLQDQTLRTYALKENTLPVLRQERTLGFVPQEARMVGQRLVLIGTSFLLEKVTHTYNEPRELDLAKTNCTSVHPPLGGRSFGRSATQLDVIPVGDIHQSTSAAFLGDNRIYVTDKSIYLFERSGSTGRTGILKVKLDAPEALRQPAFGEVKGHIKDVWALSELSGGELAVASSSGQLWDDSALNHFTILAEQNRTLKKIGTTPDYGAKEDIRSVRFVGKTAYVVTFKKTDPLFAIDVSRPGEPKILGELKIPGFSTYMHPLNDERLIGLGFDTMDMGGFTSHQGIQLSLFDTSNPLDMSRKDVQIFGVRGSSSAATEDHKAFYLDSIEGVAGFPVTLNFGCETYDPNSKCFPDLLQPPQLNLAQAFSGAALVKIEGDTFAEPQYISHADMMSEQCRRQIPTWSWWETQSWTPDIQRLFKLDGELLSVSQVGLKTFRWGNALETSSTTQWTTDCSAANLRP